MPRPGRFIVLDGAEGAGKTTHMLRLAETLRARGLEVLTVRDPGSTPVSERIRDVLLDPASGDLDARTEVCLYMASRAELVAKVVRPALAGGAVVLADRFVSSTEAYQGHAGGADPEAIRQVARFACAGLEPDLTVVLDVPVEVGFSRKLGEPDRMEAKARSYHERVREGFLAMGRQRPDRVVVVDATGDFDAVATAIEKVVDDRVL